MGFSNLNVLEPDVEPEGYAGATIPLVGMVEMLIEFRDRCTRGMVYVVEDGPNLLGWQHQKELGITLNPNNKNQVCLGTADLNTDECLEDSKEVRHEDTNCIFQIDTNGPNASSPAGKEKNLLIGKSGFKQVSHVQKSEKLTTPPVPFTIPRVPWTKLALVILGPLDHIGVQNKFMFLIVDFTSRGIKFKFVPRATTGALLEFLLDSFACEGVPEYLVTDESVKFSSAAMIAFMDKFGIKR